MELKINTEAKSIAERFGITEERKNYLIAKAGDITSVFATHRHPIISKVADLFSTWGKLESPEEQEETKLLIGDKEKEYYMHNHNLFKEIAGICDNIEEFCLVIPAAIIVMEKVRNNPDKMFSDLLKK